MNLKSAVIALACMAGFGVNAQQNQPRCASTYVRQEIRSMSANQWGLDSYILGYMQQYGWFAWFAYLHQANFGTIHNCEMFFPFHRRFIQDFESVGQRFNAGFILPYWDALRDYANPAASAVLSASYTGGNGAANTQCVTSGLQNTWTMTFPNNHCLRRSYNGGNRINSWYSPEYVQSLVTRSATMTQLRPNLEYTLHGAVHIALGGDMYQMYSPNDFVFYLHHANLDRIWWSWQQTGNHLWAIDGVDSNGAALSLDSNIIAYNEPIRTVMQLGYGNMCYTYDLNNSVSSSLRRRSTSEKKCIPKPVYNNIATAPAPNSLNEGVFQAVNDLTFDSDAYVAKYVVQQIPQKLVTKWYPANNTEAAYYAADEDDYVSSVESANLYTLESQASAIYSGIETSSYETSDYSAANEAAYAVQTAAYESEDVAAAGLDSPKYPMPKPFPFTPDWVKMHGISPEKVKLYYADSLAFVKDMNGANYQSPFAKA